MFVFSTGAVLLEVTAFWPRGAGSAGCEAEPWPRSLPVASCAWGERDRSEFSWQHTDVAGRGRVSSQTWALGRSQLAWGWSLAFLSPVRSRQLSLHPVGLVLWCHHACVMSPVWLSQDGWGHRSVLLVPVLPPVVLPRTMPSTRGCPSPMRGGL